VTTRHLKLSGERFLCVPEYVPRALLDPLAAFILRALEDEPSIPILLRSFGLPARIIEDILGELISQNLARLNLETYTIHPTEKAAPVRSPSLGREVVLWQDHLTGAVLEWSQIKQYRESDRDYGEEIEAEKSSFVHFPNLQHGRLIGMLERSRSNLLEDRQGCRLERLLNRREGGNVDIYLPVEEVAFGGDVSLYLATPELPGWVLRGWNRTVVSWQNHQNSEALTPWRSGPVSGLSWWHLPRLKGDAERWYKAVTLELERVPPPQSGSDLRAVLQSTVNLQARLRRRASVALVSTRDRKQGGSWLEEPLERAATYLIVAVSSPSRAHLDFLGDALKERAERAASERSPLRLWLLRPEPNGQHRRQDESHQQALKELARSSEVELEIVNLPSLEAGGGQAMVEPLRWGVAAVADGQVGYLGLADYGQAPRELLCLDSEDVASRLAGHILTWADGVVVEGSHLSGQLDHVSALTAVPRRAGEADDSPDRQLEGLLDGFRSRLLRCVTRPAVASEEELERRHLDVRMTGKSTLRHRDRLGAKRATFRLESVKERDPELARSAEELAYRLQEEEAVGPAHWDMMDASELGELLAEAFQPGAGWAQTRQILIVSPTLGELVSDPRFIESVRQAIETHKIRVRLVWGKAPKPAIRQEHLALAQALRSAIPDPRLTLQRLPRLAPISAIVVDDTVAFGLVDWLDSPGDGWLACLLESSVIAERVRALAADAQEISKLTD